MIYAFFLQYLGYKNPYKIDKNELKSYLLSALFVSCLQHVIYFDELSTGLAVSEP